MTDTDTKETKLWLVGVNPCGCMTAARVAESSDEEIARFRAEMQASGRRAEWRELTREQFLDTFKPCKCDVGHNSGGERARDVLRSAD